MTADMVKHAAQIHNTGFSPQALYRTPPSTGPANPAKELMILMTELAAIKCSSSVSTGMLACTEGW